LTNTIANILWPAWENSIYRNLFCDALHGQKNSAPHW